MIVRAPGKLVLSGAYSVLEGAPAIVTAVTRYAYADSSRPARFVTPEVRAALGNNAPWFCADELRAGDHKLGLGSSAAILVASLVASLVEQGGSEWAVLDWSTIRARIFPQALRAHHEAQSGGSGLDVAVSCFGGTIEYRLSTSKPSVCNAVLPAALVVETWDSGSPASTAELVGLVKALRERSAPTYLARVEAQARASERAAAALREGSLSEWLASLVDEYEALHSLGLAAGAPIITGGVVELARLARLEGGVVLPSGAGGGDVVLFQGGSCSSATFRAEAVRLGYRRVWLGLGAEGVVGPASLPPHLAPAD